MLRSSMVTAEIANEVINVNYYVAAHVLHAYSVYPQITANQLPTKLNYLNSTIKQKSP